MTTFILGLALIQSSQAQACPSLEWVMDKLDDRDMRKLAKPFPPRWWIEHAGEEIKRCPNSEAVWYGVLRAQELKNDDARADPQLAEQATQRVPISVRLATIRARALGTVEAAEMALKVDPSYAPAQVALGMAWLERGNAQRAREILEKVQAIDLVQYGPASLAQARLLTSDEKTMSIRARVP